MNPLRLIRIIATFLLVFGLGGVAGWKLKSTPAASGVGVGRIEVSAEGALNKLAERLKLTPAQKTGLLPLFEKWSSEAGRAGRNQRRRLELF